MDIAFVGLGKMGELMAGHLVAAGHDVTVWNRSPDKAEALVARGARLAATPREAAAQAGVVVSMLFDLDAVRSVILDGPDAAVAGLRDGGMVIDASTTGPRGALAVAEALAARGKRFVDAPVTGSTPVAEKGQLGVLLGGTEKDVAEARPVVAHWGDDAKIRHIGGVGAGQAMKLVMNLSLGLAIEGVGECLALAKQLDLDRSLVLDVLGGGPFGFTIGQKREQLLSRDFRQATFTAGALAKDLRLAQEVGAGGPAATGALAAADRVLADGRGDEDYSALASGVPTAS